MAKAFDEAKEREIAGRYMGDMTAVWEADRLLHRPSFPFQLEQDYQTKQLGRSFTNIQIGPISGGRSDAYKTSGNPTL